MAEDERPESGKEMREVERKQSVRLNYMQKYINGF